MRNPNFHANFAQNTTRSHPHHHTTPQPSPIVEQHDFSFDLLDAMLLKNNRIALFFVMD
jgi:hypothetical protein